MCKNINAERLEKGKINRYEEIFLQKNKLYLLMREEEPLSIRTRE